MSAAQRALLVLLLCVVSTIVAECKAIKHEDMDDAMLFYVLTLCLLGTLLWLFMSVDAYGGTIIDTAWMEQIASNIGEGSPYELFDRPC